MRTLFLAALGAAAVCLATLAGPAPTALAQPPAPPNPLNPIVAPPAPATWVSIDVEVMVDAPYSHIDGYTSFNHYYVKAVIDYGASGAGFVVKGYVYDENAGNTVSLNFGTAANPINSITTTGAGTGSVTGYFAIPVNSQWGQAITNGTFDQAWITATIQNAAVIVDDDGAWIYHTATDPTIVPVGGN